MKISKQLLQQHRNLENGWCRYHVGVPVFNNTTMCEACILKYRERNKIRAIELGVKPCAITKKQWDEVDFSKGPAFVVRKLKCKYNTAMWQLRKRGYKRISKNVWQTT